MAPKRLSPNKLTPNQLAPKRTCLNNRAQTAAPKRTLPDYDVTKNFTIKLFDECQAAFTCICRFNFELDFFMSRALK